MLARRPHRDERSTHDGASEGHRGAGDRRRQRDRRGDIADAISHIVTRPRDVAINELLIRPTEQEG